MRMWYTNTRTSGRYCRRVRIHTSETRTRAQTFYTTSSGRERKRRIEGGRRDKTLGDRVAGGLGCALVSGGKVWWLNALFCAWTRTTLIPRHDHIPSAAGTRSAKRPSGDPTCKTTPTGRPRARPQGPWTRSARGPSQCSPQCPSSS